MKAENKILEMSFDFSLQIIDLYKKLISSKEYILSKQLLRSATSIGANIEEAIGGQSDKDFYAKLTIASYKEARETHYWIRLLKYTNYLTNQQSESLLNDATELLKIIGSIQKTLRNS